MWAEVETQPISFYFPPFFVISWLAKNFREMAIKDNKYITFSYKSLKSKSEFPSTHFAR